MKCPIYRLEGRVLLSFTLEPLHPTSSHITSSCGRHKGPPVGQAAVPPLGEEGTQSPRPGRPGCRASWGQTLSYLLLPVPGQQQADLCQLLPDDLLVDHVQLQAGLWVFRECLLPGVILIIAGFPPPFSFLVTSGKLQVREHSRTLRAPVELHSGRWAGVRPP